MSETGRAVVAITVAFVEVFGYAVWTRDHWTQEQKARWGSRLTLAAFPAILRIAAIIDRLVALLFVSSVSAG